MKYGEGPPDGFTHSEWRSALIMQKVPYDKLTRAQRKLLERPRLWNGEDPHGYLWTTSQRWEWDAAIYRALPAGEQARAA
jgi:hypothetical protein